jgi:hypothetical protein
MSKDKNTFSAVTTFNLQKHPFGVEMIESFFLNWPEEIKLTAFIEGSRVIDSSKVKHKIVVKEFHDNIPEYQQFCQKYKEKRPLTDDFRFNVFRFAHKVYAIASALKNIKTKYLIWLDSDIKTHTKIPVDFLHSLVDDTCYLSYLGREDISMKHLNYSECGFLIFNTEHFIHSQFWKDMMEMYDGGELFNEREWHDSYIFDAVRKNLEISANIKNINISDLGLVDIKSEDHVFVASVLGKFMDHKKGDRKQNKWSNELLYRIKKEMNN